VLWKFAKRRTTRILGVIYPFITLTAIVATANHYIVDAWGAFIALAIGYGTARTIEYFFPPDPIEPELSDDGTVELSPSVPATAGS